MTRVNYVRQTIIFIGLLTVYSDTTRGDRLPRQSYACGSSHDESCTPCDGNIDCFDLSDEFYCPSRPSVEFKDHFPRCSDVLDGLKCSETFIAPPPLPPFPLCDHPAKTTTTQATTTVTTSETSTSLYTDDILTYPPLPDISTLLPPTPPSTTSFYEFNITSPLVILSTTRSPSPTETPFLTTTQNTHSRTLPSSTPPSSPPTPASHQPPTLPTTRIPTFSPCRISTCRPIYLSISHRTTTLAWNTNVTPPTSASWNTRITPPTTLSWNTKPNDVSTSSHWPTNTEFDWTTRKPFTPRTTAMPKKQKSELPYMQILVFCLNRYDSLRDVYVCSERITQCFKEGCRLNPTTNVFDAFRLPTPPTVWFPVVTTQSFFPSTIFTAGTIEQEVMFLMIINSLY